MVTPTLLIWEQYFGHIDIVYFKINTRIRPITSGFDYKNIIYVEHKSTAHSYQYYMAHIEDDLHKQCQFCVGGRPTSRKVSLGNPKSVRELCSEAGTRIN